MLKKKGRAMQEMEKDLEQQVETQNDQDTKDTENVNQKQEIPNPVETKEDKKLAKKKEKEDKKKDKSKEQIEELEDKLKRQMAEFENFRKRSEKEKTMMFDMGAKSVIEKMLPVVDNFERGIAAIPEQDQNSVFADGMRMIYKQLMSELETIGVLPIDAAGKPFDPLLHHAVSQVDSDDLESGSVFQELQKGYTYRDGVVRYSMVSVVS